MTLRDVGFGLGFLVLVAVLILSVLTLIEVGDQAQDIQTMALTGSGQTDLTALNLSGALTVAGATSFSGALDVDGAVTLNSTLDVDGNVSSGTGSFTVTDSVNITGAVDADSTLNVDGATTLNSTLDVDGNISSGTGAVTITDQVLVTNTLDIDGNELTLDADADSSLTVDTDDQLDFEIGGQDVISFTPSASYFTMAVYDRVPVLNKTADYTLTRYESGALVTNEGASAEITVTFPSATSGVWFCVNVSAAFTVTLQPDAADVFQGASAGDRVQNTGTAGDHICYVATGGLNWVETSVEGTWSDIN